MSLYAHVGLCKVMQNNAHAKVCFKAFWLLFLSLHRKTAPFGCAVLAVVAYMAATRDQACQNDQKAGDLKPNH